MKTFFKRIVMTILGLTVIPVVYIIAVWSGLYDNAELDKIDV